MVANQPLQYTVAYTVRHVYYICGVHKYVWMGCMARPVQWDNYRSKLCWVTISGYVMLRAMLHGTPSSSMAMLGSPDMTVRAEKSTRLPIRLPLTRPDLPLRRWPIDSNGLPERCTTACSVIIVCLEQIMQQLISTSMGSQPHTCQMPN